MTNRDKVKEVFGIYIYRDYFDCGGIDCPYGRSLNSCDNCEYKNYWSEEYKEPTKISEVKPQEREN